MCHMVTWDQPPSRTWETVDRSLVPKPYAVWAEPPRGDQLGPTLSCRLGLGYEARVDR